ncbi:unnamed protein product [Enterobius vermicularis]|uniref:Uncharacterized protein n=1 Tax=Enterobius vermicularis TaxID=51028 RepID=A0A0N4UWV1_ENTVE|nr:unnamed protein product [Enterobius vermicularis]
MSLPEDKKTDDSDQGLVEEIYQTLHRQLERLVGLQRECWALFTRPKSAQAVGTTGIKLLNGSKEYITDSSCDLTIDKNAVPSKKRRKGSVER